jgi:uracil-DNA glycosylase family 4
MRRKRSMYQISLFDMVAASELEKIEDPFILLRTIGDSDCTRCRRSLYRQSNPGQKITLYRGDPGARIWVVGKSPGMADGLEGVPFSFGSGDLLKRWLKYLGKDTETGYFMINPVFCAAADDRSPTVGELRSCSFFFDLLVSRLKPELFLCLGLTAYSAVTLGLDNQNQLANIRLSDIVGRDKPVQTRFDIPAWIVYHPAFFFKGTPDIEEAKVKTELTLGALKNAII